MAADASNYSNGGSKQVEWSVQCQRRMELQKAMAFTLIASLFSCRTMKACIPAGRDVPACCRLVVVEIRGKEGKKEAKQGMPIDRFQVSSEGGSQQTFACLSSFLTPQTSLYCKGTIRARKRGEAEPREGGVPLLPSHVL